MSDDRSLVNAEDVQKAVSEIGINVPVMASRMVGNRLELYLYGGSIVSWEPGNPPQHTMDRMYLGTLTIMELQQIAKDAGLTGYSGLKKRELVNRILAAAEE